jgi:hypothetical protein
MKVSRRAMLMGARGLALSLPFLASWRAESGFDVLSTRAAKADGTAPKRIVFWLGWWGSLHDHWTPKGTGPGFELNDIMQPLSPLKDKLTVLSGINMASLFHQAGRTGNHELGGANMLSSAGFDVTYPWGPSTEFHHSRGPTIDQVIADKLGGATKFPFLFAGDGPDHNHTVVQDVRGNDLQPTYWPHELFDRIFGEYTTDADARERMRIGRASVLDGVLPAYQHLSTRVSAADKRTVDEHLQAIRDLEQRLKNTTACTPPAKPAPPKYVGDTAVSSTPEGPYADFLDLLSMAMACDLSRVVTFSMSGRHADVRAVVKDFAAINPPNAMGDAHSYSHATWHEPENQQVWRALLTWRMQHLSNFAQKLSKMTDVDGRSVLDNTVIVHTSEIMTGLHDTIPKQEWGYSNPMDTPPPGSRPVGLPMFLLGGLGGSLKTGTHLDLSKGDTYGDALGKYGHGELYLTLARAMGIPASKLATFGDPAVCKNLVSEILI